MKKKRRAGGKNGRARGNAQDVRRKRKDLCDLPAFVVPSNKGDTVRVPNLERGIVGVRECWVFVRVTTRAC